MGKPLCRLYDIKSKYIGVSYFFSPSIRTHFWRFTREFQGKIARKDFPFTDEGERDAAIMYDKKLLEIGMDPVNILKKK